MANVTITSLPAAGAITGAESVPIVQNGVTVQTTTGAIAASPSQTQSFLTLVNEPTLPNSQRISTGSGLTSTTTGAQGQYTLAVTGAPASLISSPTGIQVKTNATTLTGVQIAVGANLGVTNANGTTGNPTISLTGLISNIASLSGTGLVAVGSGLASPVSVQGVTNQISVANGNGSGGSPTVSIANNPILPGTGGVTVPGGTTAQQPIGTVGQLRYDSTQDAFVGYKATGWVAFTTGGGIVTISGTANEVAVSAGLNPIVSLPSALTFTGKTVTNGTFNVTAATVGGDSVTTNTASQTLTNKTISGADNTLSSIANASLTNSFIVAGTTSIPLGTTAATLGGLTSVAVTQDPVSALQLATKQYVDAAVSGLNIHAACEAATTASLASTTGGTVTYNNGTLGVGATLTLSVALPVLDGYTLLNTNRVLVKNEATLANNGIYTWATGGTVLTRALDSDTAGEMKDGDYSFISNGTINASTGWVQTNTVTVVGTSPIVYIQFSGAGTYTAGTGLTLTGTQFSLTSPVTAVLGGTGQTAYAVGDLLYASTTTALSKLADVATGNALISGGVGVAPSYGQIGLTTHVSGTLPNTNGGTGQASAFTQYGVVYGSTTAVLATTAAGTSTQVLHGNASGAPTWGAVALATDVSGTLPIANGGTNSTATPTAGGAIYGTGTAHAITAAGTAGFVLTSAGASAPTWSGISGGTF